MLSRLQPLATRRLAPSLRQSFRLFSSEEDDVLNAERDAMAYDLLIVGAGPAGLAASIRAKQLAAEKGKDISVLVLEKGSEVGAHILSGNVFEPRALDELFPDWRTMDNGPPIETEVKEDVFLVLPNETASVPIPSILHPPQLDNHGNYIISLSQLTRWLGEQAEELGVEIYPGFAASEVLYCKDTGAVQGIATRDVGIDKEGKPKDVFARGMEMRARQTLFAEGARGSCSEEIMKKFDLRDGVQPQTYGLGVKEVWTVPENVHQAGFVQHTIGWPLQNDPLAQTFGGSFLYHMKPNLVLVGFVVGLDYENPYLNPYREFQRWKHHPDVSKHLEGGECISYGARVLNEGGFHAIPKLTFPGGGLIGCSAGFLNGVKIKGSHTAIKSGMVAAEAVYDLLTENEEFSAAETGEVHPDEKPMEPVAYQKGMEESWVWEELKEVRNVHASFHWGFLPGLAYSGLAAMLLKGREPWTLTNDKTDSQKTQPAAGYEPIEYPKPDGVFSFDLLTNLTRSGTDHEGDQPAHLRIKPECADIVKTNVSLNEFAGPEQRFCPAGVYEYVVDEETSEQKLQINAQNCVHCKCCSIKMPHEYINWTVPEGAGGPNYAVM
jgi:electron-transferring-flavoprotein dehydrogenase